MVANTTHTQRRGLRLTREAIAIFACLVTPGHFACGEDEPTPDDRPRVITLDTVTTGDEVVSAPLPSDLHVDVFERSLFATSADGGFRLFFEHREGQTLTGVLGIMKDQLIGLGWEPVGEHHFENAVSVEMARGPRQQRLQRHTWLIDARPGAKPGEGRVVVCEAFASASHAARLERLRELCQSLKTSP